MRQEKKTTSKFRQSDLFPAEEEKGRFSVASRIPLGAQSITEEPRERTHDTWSLAQRTRVWRAPRCSVSNRWRGSRDCNILSLRGKLLLGSAHDGTAPTEDSVLTATLRIPGRGSAAQPFLTRMQSKRTSENASRISEGRLAWTSLDRMKNQNMVGKPGLQPINSRDKMDESCKTSWAKLVNQSSTLRNKIDK